MQNRIPRTTQRMIGRKSDPLCEESSGEGTVCTRASARLGAKSIGEVVINSHRCRRISDAIRNAGGSGSMSPITPEKIAMAALEKK